MEFREFNVGDVVTVVSKPYEDCPFDWVDCMTNMCGKVVTIVQKEYSEQYKTYRYNILEDEAGCYWCGNCFLPIYNQNEHRFRINDRICARVDYPDSNLKISAGDSGIVCNIGDDCERIGVRWDNFVDGHDCGGTCEFGFGYWVDSTCIELDELSDVEIKDESFLCMIEGYQ